MKLYANITEYENGQEIWCCSISAPSSELRQMAKFMLDVAEEMDAKQGLLSYDWHKEFSSSGDSILAVGFPEQKKIES